MVQTTGKMEELWVYSSVFLSECIDGELVVKSGKLTDERNKLLKWQ